MTHNPGKHFLIAIFTGFVALQAASAFAASGDSGTPKSSETAPDAKSSGKFYEDMGGRESKRPLSFMLRLNSEESIVEGANPTMGIGGGVQLDFGKSYAVGTEFSYKRPFSQFENYSFNGGDDLAFYFTDRELYISRHRDFDLSYKLSGVLPTSQRSSTATMLGGFAQEISARKNFGKLWSLKYTLTLGEFLYEYDSSNAPTTRPQYNSPLTYGNKLNASYKATKSLKLQVGSGIKSKTDYTGATGSTYNVSSGATYEFSHDFSIDFGIRSTAKDISSSGSKDEDPSRVSSGGGSGESTADTLFDPSGTVFYLGTVLRI